MKWQFSKKEKRKVGWAADKNAVSGGRGGTWQGVGVAVGRKDSATHDSGHRAGPVGRWHRGDSLQAQHALCVGTGQVWDSCSSSGWVMGVFWSQGETGANPVLSRKSLPELPLAFLHFTVQWQFRALGIWLWMSGEELGKTGCFPWPAVGIWPAGDPWEAGLE